MTTVQRLLLAAALLLVLSGCQAKERPATFELRDFVVTKDDGGIRMGYHGRGTLVTSAPHLRDRTLLVFLEATIDDGGVQEKDSVNVIVINGVGSVTTYDMPENGPTRYVKWDVFGYIVLEPGTVVPR